MSVEKSAESILKENSDLFEGIGELEGYHHIELNKSINPVIHPPRRVPVALQERLKSEIERMEKLGIVEKKREHIILRRQEEITAKLAGAKYLSKLDASSGFWNIKLDDESSNLCMFNTPFGRFKFLRLPFGIKSASKVFHKAVCKILEGFNGVESFIDNILEWGCTKEEHDKILKEVLEQIRTANLKLRRDKYKIGISEVTYFGHRYKREGLKIDDNKVKAITEMKSPTSKKELERFLGMVTYIAKFVPKFSSNTAVLRDLLKKDVLFQ
ncbi:unnamed protein product [Mytilus coruscus]|uniref:Reverse transcriptase domain-containing protein n=1 Tax=Mytilus coruscus TaxID=42192 RepID=A0A6J8AGS4_MYTCO|nr:unnamed protein product [Mytilus coruscus]